jgi:hypothetical protein
MKKLAAASVYIRQGFITAFEVIALGFQDAAKTLRA